MAAEFSLAGRTFFIDGDFDMYNRLRNQFAERAAAVASEFADGHARFDSIADFVKDDIGYQHGLSILSSHIDFIVGQLIDEHKIFAVDRDSLFAHYFEKYCPWRSHCDRASDTYMQTMMRAKRYQEMLKSREEEDSQSGGVKRRKKLDALSIVEGLLHRGVFSFTGLLLRGTWTIADRTLDFARMFFVRSRLAGSREGLDQLAHGIGESVFNLHYAYFDTLVAEGAVASTQTIPYLNPEKVKRAAILQNNITRMEREDVLARVEEVLLANPYDARVYEAFKKKIGDCAEEIETIAGYFRAKEAAAYDTAPPQSARLGGGKAIQALQTKVHEKLEATAVRDGAQEEAENADVIDSLIDLVASELQIGSASSKREAAQVDMILRSHPNYKKDLEEARAVLAEIEKTGGSAKVREKYAAKLVKLVHNLELQSKTMVVTGKKIVFDTPEDAKAARIDNAVLLEAYADALGDPDAIPEAMKVFSSRKYSKKLRDHYRTMLSKHVAAQTGIARGKIRFMFQSVKKSLLCFAGILLIIIFLWERWGGRFLTIVILGLLAAILLLPLKQFLVMLRAVLYTRKLRQLDETEMAKLEKMMKTY